MLDNNQLQQQIIQAIQLTVTPQNTSDIKKGEQILHQIEQMQGYGPCLLFLSLNCQFSVQMRQGILAQLKLIVHYHWRKIANSDQFLISEADKQQLKSNLLQIVENCLGVKELRKLTKQISYEIIENEFGRGWDNLHIEAVSSIQSAASIESVRTPLFILSQIMKIYEMNFRNEIQNFDEKVLPSVMPCLLQLLKQLISNLNEVTVDYVYLIIKSVVSLVKIAVSSYFNDQAIFDEWIQQLRFFLSGQLPETLTMIPQNEEQSQLLARNVNWKIKAGCCRIVAKFFQQQMYQKEKVLPVSKYLGVLIEQCLQIQLAAKSQYVHIKLMFYSIKLIIYSLKIASGFEILVNNLNQLIFEIILPQLCLTTRDEKLWMEDPQEFIRREEDFTLYAENIKMIAMDLLIQICGNKSNGNEILLKFLNFVIENLENQQITWKAREAFLWVIGELQEKIQALPQITDDWLEIQFEKHVISQLNSPNCFIRGRSCWVIGRYGGLLKFADKENISQIIQGICKCILDESLPVKFKAAVSLNCLLEYKEAIEMLRPELNRILEIYLKLMNEIECEDIVSSLEGIVQRFSNEIVPFAFELVQHLCASFLKLVQNQGKKQVDSCSEIDDGENELSAAGCLTTIHRILSSPLPRNLYPKIFELLIPMFNFVFSNQGIDFCEDAFPILNLILYYGGQLTPLITAYFPAILYLILETPVITVDINQLGIPEQIIPVYSAITNSIHPLAEDQLPGMTSLLQNYLYLLKQELFIYKEPLFQKTYYELLEEMIYKVINQGFKNNYETDMIYALKLVIAIIENNSNMNNIQPVIEKIMLNSLNYLNKGKKVQFEVAVYEVLSLILYLRPSLLINYLVQCNQLLQFFQKFNKLSKHFSQLTTKKYIMYGLSSILTLNPEEMTNEVSNVVGEVIKWIVRLANEIVEARENEDFEDESDEEEDEEALLEQIKLDGANGDNKLAQKKQELEEDDDEDEDYNEMTYHAYKFRSYLMESDELQYLESIFSDLMKNKQAFYTNISNYLTENEKKQLLENFQKSKEWFAKKQKEKEEEEKKRNQ